ncbi:uncharacterized protein TRIADDRAFT_20003 [Trichoplax adhaerens]|uniref:ATP-binding cassette sub-family B member 6 n=1 Tax=Trichoplax adhaerens TaxID=10228 RepID=B3RM86_TRIAD|nr:hypothetical protein TRIADDRAFT_20003 [Trichoplax adhaerens]EDV29654.1 hypothetical protein TRIADDRAFT_20003 [Trichoplax adhaerens]|eukprot:XP_002108856.1 hypothetical protein TRIADDRAFT_20003 [Trichoplax adhaerens]
MARNIFCSRNDPFTPVWVDFGLSVCFYRVIAGCILLFLSFIVGTGYCIHLRRRYHGKSSSKIPSSFAYKLQHLVALAMAFINVAYIIIHAIIETTGRLPPDYIIVAACLSFLAWTYSMLVMKIERSYILRSKATRHGWPLFLFWLTAFALENIAFISWKSPRWWWQMKRSIDIADLCVFILKYIGAFLSLLLGYHGAAFSIMRRGARFALLVNADDKEDGNITSESKSTFNAISTKFKMLWPYVWPKKNKRLQFHVVLCFILLCSVRGVNLLVPLYYKYIVNALTGVHGKILMPTGLIFAYVGFKFLQGGGVGSMGFVSIIRSFLWIRVQQYTTRTVRVELFAHLHSLSLQWHLNRKTGEILRVMDRGASSINTLLSNVIFSILPTIADIIIAIIYFILAFNAWFGVIVFFAMVLYLIATIYITEWRTKFRRKMNKLDNSSRAKAVDSLINFETVKYYVGEEFEVDRFNSAIVEYQRSEWISLASLQLLNLSQSIIITSGLLAGSLLCANLVAEGSLKVGDYVLFATYIVQLYAPLNYFGTYYRTIQQSFIDMENMLDLMKAEVDVKDIDNAPELNVTKGEIEFRDVCFHYNSSRPVLKNISFSVLPGQTVALVGPSGSGKSTIIRLLFRFYDIHSGTILFDGQDITKISQRSLRKAIGVVPQDTVLFHESIRYNVRYGRADANDDEVEEAAAAADIHDRVLRFTDKYDTVVGERGLKLSGGEKQRVAIARTILKSPQFVLLDEATSALDTQTERNIQTSLTKVCANRTTVVVAHRLSTIINADLILVLKDGEIIERGRHEDLLEMNGKYAQMWAQQSENEENNDASRNLISLEE